ncbi:uncharacterized protein N7473_005829 [Penicillium subrubescens]|uniref:uncharacterized protein n=1 Tax=Penicillium subrubescens TaxID=1316194 RepID=UPI0025453BCA|nr:uncharacterized protein N7473_005829 [Penicillium subrubescens]KAJ5896430.1 hypothetical protein N7473_005829 [Penicillium subrubescens]
MPPTKSPIRDSFLPPSAPSNAHAQQIDFEKSNPPLPKYKGHFAAIIDDFLTESECKELLSLAEKSTPNGWERAMVNVGGGRQELATDARNCGRMMWDTHDIANRLLTRLKPFLHDLDVAKFTDRTSVTGLLGRGKTYELSALNERLRFLRYVGGEYFRPHWDGQYEAPNGDLSFYTLHLYLNGEGEQDVVELGKAEDRPGNVNPDPEGTLLGGATSFIPIPSYNSGYGQLRGFSEDGEVVGFSA